MTTVAVPTDGEVSCMVHLSATVRSFMRDGGAVLVIREIQNNTNPVSLFCSCRIEAAFHVMNVGRPDQDDPFPMFQRL